MTTQRLGRSHEPVVVLRRVLVSGPITALIAASPRHARLQFFGAARQALAVATRRFRKDSERQGRHNMSNTNPHHHPFNPRSFMFVQVMFFCVFVCACMGVCTTLPGDGWGQRENMTKLQCV